MYAYCATHNVSWNGDLRDYCLECMEILELDRPWTDEEAMQAGYPNKPIGTDDRREDVWH